MKQKETDKRSKVCVECGNSYQDTTKRNTSKTCSKACSNAKMVRTRKANGSYKRTAEQNAKMVATTRQRYGSFAACQTEASREKNRQSSKAMWTDEFRERMKQVNLERYGVENVYQADAIKEKIRQSNIEKYGVDHWMKTEEGRKQASERAILQQEALGFEERSRQAKERWKKRPIEHRQHRTSFGNGGKRRDLGDQYFRSNWEANIARIMDALSLQWEYEPVTHVFDDGSTYFPDFRIDLKSGKQLFIEVKGYEDNDGMVKWKRFCKDMSKNDTIICHLIDSAEYAKFRAMFKHMKNFNWEGK